MVMSCQGTDPDCAIHDPAIATGTTAVLSISPGSCPRQRPTLDTATRAPLDQVSEGPRGSVSGCLPGNGPESWLRECGLADTAKSALSNDRADRKDGADQLDGGEERRHR